MCYKIKLLIDENKIHAGMQIMILPINVAILTIWQKCTTKL